MSNKNGAKSRDYVIDKLYEEMIGPAPNGNSLDCSKSVVFNSLEETYQAFKQKDSGDEILQRDAPLNRYGSAILFPVIEKKEEKETVVIDKHKTGKITFAGKERESSSKTDNDKLETSESVLSSANLRLPESMGISFLSEIKSDSKLVVSATAGRYRKLPIIIKEHQKTAIVDNCEVIETVNEQKRTWWKREQISIEAEFNGEEFSTNKESISPSSIKTKNTDGLDLSVNVISRPTKNANQYLITVVLINRTIVIRGISRDECAVFQTGFNVEVLSDFGIDNILPYPNNSNSVLSEEEKSIELLYRNANTYAVGHGCSADWSKSQNGSDRAAKVTATHFPIYELPSVTSEIKNKDGFELKISMAKLAGLIENDNGLTDLELMLEQYEHWIKSQTKLSKNLESRFQKIAEKNLFGCRERLSRMKDGLRFLKNDKKAFNAFQMANHAILIQQHRSKQSLRTPTFVGKYNPPKFSSPQPNFDLTQDHEYLGHWRGFQIAFLLLSVESAASSNSSERETVELIWFPTGGGKTEAYLGLAAFSLFYRRLTNPQDTGTHIFLRYTLRLLTAQQFERAGALICAMEVLRRQNSKALGTKEISIALWLGNDVTPGTSKNAIRVLRSQKSHPHLTENKFILNRCPWCAAQIGKIESVSKNKKKTSSKAAKIIGYKEQDKTVIFHCPDENCEFSKQLPIYVIDEDVYKVQPSMFIATVDKFAVLAWKPEARSLFGLDKNGNREYSPPGLIIQDELHLISGPLGTMVGLYEPLVEELCTDYRNNSSIKPKIVCSTATTRQYKEQVRSLFAREQTELFPPPGIDIGDSFFAKYARDKKDNLLPGRKYIGINAPGLGSIQNTEVRIYTALLQASANFPANIRDQYWTLFIFYNNLKMLGNTISLFQSNIPGYFLTYQNRTRQKLRRIRQPLELTGRLKSDEIPAVLRRLEIKCGENPNEKAVDVCLASCIAEVGMDVGRLATMAMVGQTKSVAQYIQITGRVGRIADIPGLIAIIFSSTQPRDRSHFEYFRSFHERLYAQVEPLSVTPFSIPALERGLHGVMTAFIRQIGNARQSQSPYPMPEEKMQLLKEILIKRIQIVAPEMQSDFEKIFDKRLSEWRRWECTRWTGDFITGDYRDALIRPYEKWTDETSNNHFWMTPISMRNVDAQAEFGITDYYQSV